MFSLRTLLGQRALLSSVGVLGTACTMHTVLPLILIGRPSIISAVRQRSAAGQGSMSASGIEAFLRRCSRDDALLPQMHILAEPFRESSCVWWLEMHLSGSIGGAEGAWDPTRIGRLSMHTGLDLRRVPLSDTCGPKPSGDPENGAQTKSGWLAAKD